MEDRLNEIEVRNGKVMNFLMNDKCAAGTGRFLEMTAHRLDIDMSRWGELLVADECCRINSMCAVFAESEIISLLASGEFRESVAGGVIESIADRMNVLAGKIQVTEPIMLTGGLTYIDKLRLRIGEKLGYSIGTSEYARYAGAIGAAILGVEKAC